MIVQCFADSDERRWSASFGEQLPPSFSVYTRISFLDIVECEYDRTTGTRETDFFSKPSTDLQHIVYTSVYTKSLLMFTHKRFRKSLQATSDNASEYFYADAKQSDASPLAFI